MLFYNIIYYLCLTENMMGSIFFFLNLVVSNYLASLLAEESHKDES